ncbi:hypothetical protein [Ornithinibacillus halotolerans]|uniref:Uncharacterized protein n=1 Tax=Ornithinibacillus halotolerans TaxID=1274357 RepID=A0A916WCG4_9BACI|nr:hypothetical protein [Ornithinibacillus halotolerans]GGA85502.1 hypothetical protein GCM10008025_30640 [Ornithinibacillus halotolerans]
MTINRVKIGLYILAIIATFFLFFIPLASDYTIDNRFIRKAIIGVPLFLFIIGKLLTVKDKKNNHIRFDKDIYIMIGLTFGYIFFLFS